MTTNWCKAIATRDGAWLSQNLSESSLDGFHANAVSLYGQDGRPLYAKDNLHGPGPLDLPVPASAFVQIFSRRSLAHFFIQLPQGLTEIRAGTVHPSKDFRRESPAYGYVFAGRLWSKPAPGGTGADSVIGEMSMFTGNEVRLVPASEPLKSGRQRGREWDDRLFASLARLDGHAARPAGDPERFAGR